MKREKIVHEVEQVAHLWAHQAQSEARNSAGNFFFTGDTIYSYGSHFPIARHVKRRGHGAAILYTTRGYSSTTAKHKGIVNQAIPGGAIVFTVPNMIADSAADHAENKKHYRDLFDTLLVQSVRATSHADSLRAQAERVSAESATYAKFYGLKWSALTIDADYAEKIKTKVKSQRQADAKRAEREAAAKDKAARIQRERLLPIWLTGEEPGAVNGLYGNPVHWNPSALPFAYLRVNPNDSSAIETTRGAHFPIDHARRAWRFLSALRAAGKGFQRNGQTIHVGHFQIDTMEAETGLVVAGCHWLEWSELARFAAAQGWPAGELAELPAMAEH